MAQKPSIPKGTRDFSPIEVAKRNYIFSIIKSNFEKFGFQPIETPSFENSETLMGKYGEEGDRLIFKILNSGEFFGSTEKIIKSKTYLETIVNKEFFIEFYQKISKNYSILHNIIDLNSKINEIDSAIIKNELKVFLKNKSSEVDSDKYPFQIEWKNFVKAVLNNHFDIFFKSSLDIISKIYLKCSFELYMSNINILILNLLNSHFSKILSSSISEKALRYDLTVPFARYVVQHQNEIEFPFKRYQIQPVWRADRPQKGRFREFYQCDADVVGSNSLWQEVELVQLYDAVFTELGLKGVTIKINNRKILSGIAEVIGASDKLIDFTVALDKLDKIGEDGVKKEMLDKGISAVALEKVQPLFDFSGTINEKIAQLKTLLVSSTEGLKGVEELQFICDAISDLGLQSAHFDLDVTLARGLNYYTGAIFEVAAPQGVAMGSIGGGGRYDDLTGIFGLKNMSGVGISFGLDRIALVIEELNLFPNTVSETSKALFLNFGEKEALYAMKAISKLRNQGLKVELYPDNAKIAKQFQHADRRGIPFAILVGEEEMQQEIFTLKNLNSGTQEKVDFVTLVTLLQ